MLAQTAQKSSPGRLGSFAEAKWKVGEREPFRAPPQPLSPPPPPPPKICLLCRKTVEWTWPKERTNWHVSATAPATYL